MGSSFRTASSSACGVLVKTISILGAQDASVLTGAPAASATYLMCWVMNAVYLAFWPTTIGQMWCSQRAILPVTCVSAAKVWLKSWYASRDPVTVTLSVDISAD